MKSISKTFSQLKFKKLDKCNPKPGYKDSCEGCKNCKKGKGLVYEEEIGGQCCYMPAPNFGNESSAGNYVSSNILEFREITCSVVFECKFETIDGWDSSSQIVKINTQSGGASELTRNQWFSFSMEPGDGIFFEFINNLLTDKCISIHLKNHDCNINYGTVGTLCTIS